MGLFSILPSVSMTSIHFAPLPSFPTPQNNPQSQPKKSNPKFYTSRQMADAKSPEVADTLSLMCVVTVWSQNCLKVVSKYLLKKLKS